MLNNRFSTIFALPILILIAGPVWAATTITTTTYLPPPKVGDIYTVINYKRTVGTTQNTSVSVRWGTFSKSATITAPYDSCSQSTPAGFVLKLRHLKADRVLLTLSTSGTFVGSPNQGVAPPEWLHKCYKQMSW